MYAFAGLCYECLSGANCEVLFEMVRVLRRRIGAIAAYVLGGWFCFVVPSLAGQACTDLKRAVDAVPTGPVFLTSYPTVNDGPLKGTAFLYDNAAAALALKGCGASDQARRIGDAILAGVERDPFWRDGRLRNAYAAGAVDVGPVKTAGWWDNKQNKWVGDPYMSASDTGNLAWALLALLALDRDAQDEARQGGDKYDGRYLRGAERLADRVLSRRDGNGFSGGYLGFEPNPQRLSWKSVEHNTDIAAAFWQMAARTGIHKWRAAAEVAGDFVTSMWNHGGHRYDAGSDLGVHDRTAALDAQVWPMLALYSAHRVELSAFAYDDGYSYGMARGVWTEGTAQVAVLMASNRRWDSYRRLMTALEKRHDERGFYRASDKALATGFRLAADPSQPRQFFPLPHLGATAWVAFAEQKYNPFRDEFLK